MSFEVHQPNIDNMQQYLQNEKSKNKDYGDGPKWYSFPNGMSSVRILPPWDMTGRVALPVYMHPIEYQEEGMKFKKYNWTCTEKTLGKPCKICEGLQRLSEAGVDVSKYEASRRQFYMNAIIMFDPVYNADASRGKRPEDCGGVAPGTHVLLKVPKTIYDWIISQITTPMIGDITSLTNGIDIFVTKEGTGLGTKYTPTLSPNGRTAVPQEYLDKIENLYNLDEIFGSGFDADQINRMVNSLNTSASAIGSQMPGVVQQMAGYNQQMNPVTPAQPNIPFNVGNAPMQAPAPSPYMSAPAPSPYSVPNTPVAPTIPSQTISNDHVNNSNDPNNSTNKPKCFGNYNPAQVNCVVCPEEINCMNSKRG